MLNEVNKLFKKNLSTYDIAKRTELPISTVQRLRNGKTPLEKASYSSIEILYNYYMEMWGSVRFDKGSIKKSVEIIDSESIERFEDNESGNAVEVDLTEFEDGIKLFSVTSFTDNVCDENSTYFYEKKDAMNYAEFILN